jgi:GTP-binding protein
LTFVDNVIISVSSGNGGNGKVSFRREKFVAKGGPDGGDGGRGGDVIIKTSNKISTFLDLSVNRKFVASNGQDGMPRKKTGKDGIDCVIVVPCGTLIYDNDTNQLMNELVENDDFTIVAEGGKGGRGNVHFSSSKIQVPKRSTPGKKGESKTIRLELKLIADVGLIGSPNAGKSTLLKTITQANPKVANYPFTTLYPNLGILRQYNQDIIIADIPGIIEGAAQGVGLGNQFLRHISRSNVLVILIEPVIDHLEHTKKTLENIKNELNQYDPSILKKKQIIIALSKIDLLSDDEKHTLQKLFNANSAVFISCYSKIGLSELEERITKSVHETNNH